VTNFPAVDKEAVEGTSVSCPALRNLRPLWFKIPNLSKTNLTEFVDHRLVDSDGDAHWGPPRFGGAAQLR